MAGHGHAHGHGPVADRFHRVIHFDEWAVRYDASPLQRLLFGPTHAAVIEAISNAGRRPKVVLDLGCGTGRLLKRAAEAWPEASLIGIDAAAEMVEQARRSAGDNPRLRFEVGDAAALSLESASVDAVCTTVSFHHWADQRGGVREAARVLRPGGLFVLADFPATRLLQPVLRPLHSSGSRRRMLNEAGFDVIDERRPLRTGGTVLITVACKRV